MAKKIHKINSIAWHMDNLSNMKRSWEGMKANRDRITEDLKRLGQEIVVFGEQITTAIKLGKESFDREKLNGKRKA